MKDHQGERGTVASKTCEGRMTRGSGDRRAACSAVGSVLRCGSTNGWDPSARSLIHYRGIVKTVDVGQEVVPFSTACRHSFSSFFNFVSSHLNSVSSPDAMKANVEEFRPCFVIEAGCAVWGTW